MKTKYFNFGNFVFSSFKKQTINFAKFENTKIRRFKKFKKTIYPILALFWLVWGFYFRFISTLLSHKNKAAAIIPLGGSFKR